MLWGSTERHECLSCFSCWEAKNNHILQTSVTALQRQHTGLQTIQATLTFTLKKKDTSDTTYCTLHNYPCRLKEQWEEENKKSTLPPWPTPFMVVVMHQQKSQQLERAKWTFSREHSLNLKALSYFPSTMMPLTATGAPSRRLACLDKSSLAQISIEGRARELLGGGYQQRGQMLQASCLVWHQLQKGCGGALTVQTWLIKQQIFTHVV